jgi:4-diphosphocytidyl-2-C-methyl-D-erythritol kinase
MIRIHAPAKVNWFLEIVGKRPDGFHEIETAMQAISLFDDIAVEDADELSLDCDIDLGPPHTNLAWRAAALLQGKHATGRGARITLRKRIPHGAGLGGGSSDAACTLVALDRLWNLNLPAQRLRELAGEVGSDCAFFVEGGTAHCTGRGEIIRPLPDVTGFDVVILYPEAVCPTGPVYAHASNHLTGQRETCYLAHDSSQVVDRKTLGEAVFNRLQASAIAVSGKLRAAWDVTTNERGVVVRFVSGSGSSIAFLMEGPAEAQALAESLQQRGLGRSFATRTLPRGAVWG